MALIGVLISCETVAVIISLKLFSIFNFW